MNHELTDTNFDSGTDSDTNFDSETAPISSECCSASLSNTEQP